MWLWTLLLLPLLAYLAILLLVYFSQTAMLFPTGLALPSGPVAESSRPLELITPSRHHLHGVHIPPAAIAEERRLILGFGGNAWNAGNAAEYLHELYPQADVVAFHYRGYAPSGGSPSADAVQQDSLLIHDFVRQRFPTHRVVTVGFSIGTAVAAHLASRRPIDGAILVTPFDSLAKVAAGHYPWLPVRLLFRHRMEPAEDLKRARIPVVIIAAGSDTLIPAARTEALARAIPNLASGVTIAGATHNDIYERSEFRRAMNEALEQLLSRN
jgi:uncharacterized protein